MKGPTEGLWYVVRFPKAWRLLTVYVPSASDFGHEWYWESCVAPRVGSQWQLSVYDIKRLTGLVYGFPRGRVVRLGRSYVVYHGGDLEHLVTAADIVRAFRLPFQTVFDLDQHEVCLHADKEAVRAILHIEEDWSAR